MFDVHYASQEFLKYDIRYAAFEFIVLISDAV